MIETHAPAIEPRYLDVVQMAQVLAAVVALEDEVEKLVALLAPNSARGILDELRRLAFGDGEPDAVSPALRWILPEIHHELGRRLRAAAI